MLEHSGLEAWQLIVLWFLVQVLQTVQIAVLGRKVTRTLMPPPMLRQREPNYAYRTCQSCGELRPVSELNDNGLCRDCGITEPTRPTTPNTPTVRRRPR